MITKYDRTIQRFLSVALCLIVLLYVFPYIWMIATSLKPDSELFSGMTFPQAPSLIQYERVLVGYQTSSVLLTYQFPRYYANSLFVTITTVLLVLTFDALAAFAFSKFNFRGKKLLFWLMILTMMLPVYATIIPSFYLFSKILGWVNQYQSLIIPSVVDAYGIFLLTQYMKSIPSELLDAARIDGANPLKIFWYVIVPLSRPALGTLAIFKFLIAWNDYLWPLVMIRQEEMYTLTIGIAQMQERRGLLVWGVQMAASVMATIPVIILVFAMQKQFLRGLSAGAIKA